MTAPTFSNLTGGGTSAAQSANTASISPSANRLILVTVHAYISTGSAQPGTPTVTGNGITYALVGSQDVDNSGTDRATIFVFRGMAAAPSAGAVTISFAPATMTRIQWSIDQSDANVDTSGTNGSGAIVQTTGVTTASGATSASVNYPSAMTSGNSGYSGWGHQVQEAKTPRAGWTELADVTTVTLAAVETQYIAGTDTAGSVSWASGSRGGGIIVEIAAATSAAITGTAAPTQAADTSAASGKLGYTGTAGPAQAANTSAASGKLGYTGTAAPAQAADTSAASGKLGYTGTAGPAQASDTATGAGKLGYTGTAASTQAANTSAASGTVTAAGITGSAAPTQAPDASTASGVLGYAGSAATAQEAHTAAASGVLGYAGAASPTQAADTAVASGVVLTEITGTVAVTQASQTAAASGATLSAITPRPNTGTTARPSTGRTTRPYAGVTPQP